jgi:hypothetical protein
LAPTEGYAVGSTTGVMPRAQDPSGRGLGDGDSVVTKVDTSGSPDWVRQFGSFAPDRATGVASSEGGDAVVVGITGGDAAGRSLGGNDGYVARFDPSGNQRWSAQVGSTALALVARAFGCLGLWRVGPAASGAKLQGRGGPLNPSPVQRMPSATPTPGPLGRGLPGPLQ